MIVGWPEAVAPYDEAGRQRQDRRLRLVGAERERDLRRQLRRAELREPGRQDDDLARGDRLHDAVLGRAVDRELNARRRRRSRRTGRRSRSASFRPPSARSSGCTKRRTEACSPRAGRRSRGWRSPCCPRPWSSPAPWRCPPPGPQSAVTAAPFCVTTETSGCPFCENAPKSVEKFTVVPSGTTVPFRVTMASISVHVPRLRVRVARDELDLEGGAPAAARAGARVRRRVRRAGVQACDGRDENQKDGYAAHGPPLPGRCRGRRSGSGVSKDQDSARGLALDALARTPSWPKKVMSNAVSISSRPVSRSIPPLNGRSWSKGACWTAGAYSTGKFVERRRAAGRERRRRPRRSAAAERAFRRRSGVNAPGSC